MLHNFQAAKLSESLETGSESSFASGSSCNESFSSKPKRLSSSFTQFDLLEKQRLEEEREELRQRKKKLLEEEKRLFEESKLQENKDEMLPTDSSAKNVNIS